MADVSRIHDRYISSAETVWRAITEPELLGRWLGDCPDFALEVGRRFTLRLPARPWFDGVIEAEVIHVDPGRTWQMTWCNPALHQPTVARLSVIATPTGCRLEITHSGFSGGGFKMKILHIVGWQKVLWVDLPRLLKTL